MPTYLYRHDEEVRRTFDLSGPRARVVSDRANEEVHAEVEESARSEEEHAR